MTTGRAALALVEAAYQPSTDETAWLDALASSGRDALDRGLGVVAYCFRREPARRFEIGAIAARGAESKAVATLVVATRLSRERELRRIYFETPLCTTLSEFTGVPKLRRSRVARVYGALTGIADFLAIKGTDAGSRGVALGVFLPAILPLTDAFREVWEHVGAHLAAAHRLQGQRAPRGDGLPEGTEAVLDPGGTVVHAEGEARAARATLGDAARRIDQARATRGDEALATWPALLEARWSLVDHFERDGRRFLVARSNAAETSAPAGLTVREAQVVAYSSRGHPHKLIAYELGVTVSTVRTLEARAMKKLRVGSRVELIALVRAMT